MPKSLDNAGVGPETTVYIFTPIPFAQNFDFTQLSITNYEVPLKYSPSLFFLTIVIIGFIKSIFILFLIKINFLVRNCTVLYI